MRSKAQDVETVTDQANSAYLNEVAEKERAQHVIRQKSLEINEHENTLLDLIRCLIIASCIDDHVAY